MSEDCDCGSICAISYDGDDYGEFQVHEMRTARKNYICCECGRAISPGDKYEYVAGKWDSGFATHRTCALCVEIREAFSCGNGYCYTRVWEGIEESGIFERFDTRCLNCLSTAKAKKFLVERWQEWKGLRK